ncbi:hypothetical protein FEZ32_00550 [Acidipropionibacterium jensenii]|uniref:hypothetical protein n=1 Tax=Acidipropionibacterium jensenii TaxID=1749 RepID=UPI00110B04F3|nr:hypothetical protein [Acidipropionibacterium jensenii]QCV87056.1 hypothetical protein FEZ32_00550 [Acidipropionibacterium jensenii]
MAVSWKEHSMFDTNNGAAGQTASGTRGGASSLAPHDTSYREVSTPPRPARTQLQKDLGDIAIEAIAKCEAARRNRNYLHTNRMWSAAEAIADTLGMTVEEILANQQAAEDAYAWARILPDDPDWEGVAA